MKETRHLGVYGLTINNRKIALVLKSRGAYIDKLDETMVSPLTWIELKKLKFK